ncbi:MAG: hypothetical protein V4850_01290 [Myxococcota bacterium]
MSHPRLFSAIALTALVTGTVVGGLTLSRPVRADTPPTAVCSWQYQGARPPQTKEGFAQADAAVASWMSAQLAAGKTNFVLTQSALLPTMCAW